MIRGSAVPDKRIIGEAEADARRPRANARASRPEPAENAAEGLSARAAR